VGSSSSFRGPEWRRRVRRPHTEVVTVDTAIAATHRWTDGARGRGFGSVWGNGRRGHPRLSGGPSGVRRPHTEVVAVDATTTVTHRWTDGACGRGLGSVWGNGRRGRPRRFQVRVLSSDAHGPAQSRKPAEAGPVEAEPSEAAWTAYDSSRLRLEDIRAGSCGSSHGFWRPCEYLQRRETKPETPPPLEKVQTERHRRPTGSCPAPH
jgi:hypothetical protein